MAHPRGRSPADGAAGTVTVVVPAALRFVLPARDRAAGSRVLRFDPDATLGHLVRAAGVPPTEVGALELDGHPATAADRARPGSTVVLDEVLRPQATPPGGYLLDVGLGGLARRMRLLGLDASWSNRADDADLVARATAEGRALLTQDRGLLMRRAVRSGALVRGGTTDDQLTDVLDRFRPALAPLTRCTVCGEDVRRVPTAEVAHLLEPGTRRTVTAFSRCAVCGRVYWRGAHARRIDALVEGARQRSDP